MTTPATASDRAVGRAPMLAVRDLRVTSASGAIVAGLDLTVAPGETVAIVGESGSGKSMTVKALTGLLPEGVRAAGRMELPGRASGHSLEIDLAAPGGAWREVRGSRVALLLQDPFTSLSPVHRCGEQIGWAISGPGRAERVARLLAEVGLPADVAGKYPFQLSGGMRQRVAIAAGLAADPDLLIADEPTTALDVTTQHEVLELIARLQCERDMGLILITHDLRLARSRADRVMVMYAGRLIEEGPIARVMDAPAHPYTARLAACDPPLTHRLPALPTIPGSVPRPWSVADECAFAARCAFAVDACRTAEPRLAEVSEGHRAACLRPETAASPVDGAAADGAAAPIRREVDAAPQDAAADGGQDAQAASGAPAASAPIGPEADAAPPGAAADGAASPPLLSVEGLAKRFPGSAVPALDGVDLEIAAGEAVAVVGESGSGKTTLARCVVGLERADDGRITFHGAATGARRVQIVFQDPYSALNPGLTVGTSLAEALRAAGRPKSEVGELLELVGLPAAYARRRPRALSGGERQRVAIARALAPRADLLVCDESVSALDVSVQAQVLNLLADLRRRLGLTLLFITHDLAVARQIADRVYVMHHGRVVETGPVDSVLGDPAHEYTQRLLASIPAADQAN
ncbi:dipeptide ABC transporter ATP-binding protein [Microtetraspora niveoalba]|uniref:dipeptide ABC transporter ATP-binding protein n=1 Tax=Microtetraspora niveoalba TaxID=46175 RepID=UPI0008373433|nr:ABC transporter ATP-binding protein [Microtetraspora niveoalba]